MKTILCFGDSNTHGAKAIDFDLIGCPFTASDYRFDKETRWTGVLQKVLGKEYEVIEEGLNGRTTVWDDPVEGIHKNGARYLPACLESHAPIDVVVIMLGTNDLKPKFSVEAFDIAMSIGVLINIVKKSGCGPGGSSPEILVICPPPLGKLSYLEPLFGEAGARKSKELSVNLKKVAELYKCGFLDAGKIIMPSDKDGVHYDAPELKKLGNEVAKKVKEMTA
ncbi:MAG: SGNH/GDSL hydrolase family protein [Actinobacteria bacterium]|nr:SGNH/GDSL hydrolase family protein [Actinomycetota bacterium]